MSTLSLNGPRWVDHHFPRPYLGPKAGAGSRSFYLSWEGHSGVSCACKYVSNLTLSLVLKK